MPDIVTEIKTKPFLKWAGGKTQLLGEIIKYVPPDYNKFIEPFIGAGAVFFNLKPGESIIADTNQELIITYEVIRDNSSELIEELQKFQNIKEKFYEVRKWELSSISKVTRAARFIYLNKTCYNGLYRVNKQGLFNTPFGKRVNPTICDEEVIISTSKVLANTKIIHEDFENVLSKYAAPGDFVFLDPPYVPVSQYADFKRYTIDYFIEEDHIRLKNQFDRLVQLGAYPLLTNSDAPFVLNLFKDYEIKVINTRRSISSNSNTRKGKDVIIIGR